MTYTYTTLYVILNTDLAIYLHHIIYQKKEENFYFICNETVDNIQPKGHQCYFVFFCIIYKLSIFKVYFFNIFLDFFFVPLALLRGPDAP